MTVPLEHAVETSLPSVQVSAPGISLATVSRRSRKLPVVTPPTGWLKFATTAPLIADGVVNVTDVGPVTVKHAVHVDVEPPSVVTVTSRAVVAAPGSIVTFTVRLLELFTVTLFTSTPVPENWTSVGSMKPAPATERFQVPCPRWAGVMTVTLGGTVMVMQLQLPCLPSRPNP